MTDIGDLRKAALGERAEVLRLRAEGVSVRDVAARVFGDRRYRSRVERIVDADRRGQRSGPCAITEPSREVDLPELEAVESFRSLYERSIEALRRQAKPPSGSEVKALMAVHQRLEAMEALDRMRRLTGGQTSSARGEKR